MSLLSFFGTDYNYIVFQIDSAYAAQDLLDSTSALGGCNDVLYNGYTYDVVLIGEQCWFAENLRTGAYANGQSIPQTSSWVTWSNTTSGHRRIYGSLVLPSSCPMDQTFSWDGYWYNYYAVQDSRGLCPYNWHVPTEDDWNELIEVAGAGDSGEAALALKGSPFIAPVWNGTNSLGFNATPGGEISSTGWCMNYGCIAWYWSDTYVTPDNPQYPYLGGAMRINSNASYTSSNDPNNGYFVRCVRN